jgi:hypothetical protein
MKKLYLFCIIYNVCFDVKGEIPSYNIDSFPFLLFLLVAWWWLVFWAESMHEGNVYNIACCVLLIVK